MKDIVKKITGSFINEFKPTVDICIHACIDKCMNTACHALTIYSNLSRGPSLSEKNDRF